MELRHLRRRHQQPLEVADAAARAAAGLGRFRARDREGSAAHHQPVLGRVRRALGRRRQHDHQERHQRRAGSALRACSGPATRRASAAGAASSAVQPAAVRRRHRRPARQGQACSTSAATSGAASAARWRSPRRTSPGRSVPTPADEHQGHFRGDYPLHRRSNSLAVRYNMVRWQKDNETGGLNLPGTGYIWDNNVDTVHGTFTTVGSPRFLNEVRGQCSRYTDRRAAKCDCVSAFNRTDYSISGGNDQGTWGVIPEDDLRHLSDTVSLWLGNHTIKTGASFTYDVTEQLLPAAAERRLPLRRRPGASRRRRSSSTQSFALVPEARLMYPEGLRLQRLRPGRLARPQQPDAQPRPALRRRVHQGHPRLAGADRQEQLRSARRLRLGSEGRSEVVGARRLRPLHAAAPDLHHRQGRCRRTERHGDAVAGADRPAVSDVPQCAAGLPAGRGAAAARTSRRSRPTSRTSSPGRQHRRSSGSSARARAIRSTPTSTAASKHGFLDINQPAPIPKAALNARWRRTDASSAPSRRPTLTRPIPAGAQRVPAHRGPDQRRAVLVSGRSRSRRSTGPTPLTLTVSYTLLEGRGSPEPLVRARRQLRSRARSRAGPAPTRRTTSSPARHGTFPAAAPVLQRMAAERRRALAERQPVYDPLRRRPDRHDGSPRAAARLPGRRSPGARNTERGTFINYTDVTLSRTFADRRATGIEFRADVLQPVQQLEPSSPTATSASSATANFGQHTGGSARLPGPAVPVRGDVSILTGAGLGTQRLGARRELTAFCDPTRRWVPRLPALAFSEPCMTRSTIPGGHAPPPLLTLALASPAARPRRQAGPRPSCRPSSATSSSRSTRPGRRARPRTS